MEIPKVNKKRDNFPCWANNEGSNGEKLKPSIICKCGTMTDISNHHVHSDGSVTESYYHAQEGGCGWHIYLELENYHGAEFLPDKK